MPKINYDNVSDTPTVRRSTSPNRPYPGVTPTRRGGTGWDASYQNNGRKIHLVTFKSPELARFIVLEKQAEYLEQKAARYRAEALEVISYVP